MSKYKELAKALQDYGGKAVQALSKPQELALQKAAETLNAEGGKEAAFNIVQNLSERANLPEDNKAVNAAKALGVAGLEVFADPLNAVPGLGVIKKGAKVLSKMTDAEKIEKLVEAAYKNPEKFPKEMMQRIEATIKNFKETGKLKQDFGKVTVKGEAIKDAFPKTVIKDTKPQPLGKVTKVTENVPEQDIIITGRGAPQRIENATTMGSQEPSMTREQVNAMVAMKRKSGLK